jgi:uncharacterized protein YggE
MLRGFGLVAAMGIVAATLLLVVGIGGSEPAQGAEPTPSHRTLAVVGSGSVSAAPDTAVWSFGGVESRADTTRVVLKQNNRSINRMIVELKKLGFVRADIRTENVSVFANHRGTKVTGFIANNQVSVTVRALGKSGAIIAAVTDAGANNVFGPQLSIADQADIREQAIDAAFDQAAQKA